MTSPCAALRAVFDEAVRAVAPDSAIERHLRRKGSTLFIDEKAVDLSGGRLLVLAAGKGAAPMARAIETLLCDRIDEGVAVVKTGHTVPLKRIRLMQAAHPVPDATSVLGARALLELAASAGENDTVIALITGGASSLTSMPVEGVTLEDIRETTRLLLTSGADIHEINAVRKHLTQVGGAGLAKAAYPARVFVLVVSDVVGDELDAIASGPFFPDSSSYADCMGIFERHGLTCALPAMVLLHIRQGACGMLPETPKKGDRVFERIDHSLIATNRQALLAAGEHARALGLVPVIDFEPMTGDGAQAVCAFVQRARELARENAGSGKRICLVRGGETTVVVRGSGLGGRNQEMALRACEMLRRDEGITVLFAGTDGTDGPTDAAGGFASSAIARKLDAIGPGYLSERLADNDSYHALEAVGALVRTGPTLTNVMDVALALIEC